MTCGDCVPRRKVWTAFRASSGRALDENLDGDGFLAAPDDV
jgi:hypothetical protein